MALTDIVRDIHQSATHLGGSLRIIRNEIRNASSSLRRSGITNYQEWDARYKRISLESGFENARSVVERSNRLFHADRIMNRNPGRFKTADQVFAWEDWRARRNPIAYEKKLYKEKYGPVVGEEVWREDKRKEYNTAINDLHNPLDKERRELTTRFGYAARANQYISDRAKMMFNNEMMDEKQAFLHHRINDLGYTDEQANAAYFHHITENSKWLRKIAGDNPKLIKALTPIAKGIDGAASTPIIGKFIKHPLLAGGALAMGGLLKLSNSLMDRSKTIVGWQNIRNIVGDASGRMFGSSAGAGMTYDETLKSLMNYSIKSSQAKFGIGFDKYASIAKYGGDISALFDPTLSPEERRKAEYKAIMSLPKEDRMAAMAEMGMDIKDFNAEGLGETKRYNWSLENLQQSHYNTLTKSFKENHPLLDAFVPNSALKLWANIKAADEYNKNGFARRGIKTVDDVYSAAQSMDQYDSSGGTGGNIDNSRTNQVTMNLGGITIQTNDPNSFAEGLMGIASNSTNESLSIISYYDTKRIG